MYPPDDQFGSQPPRPPDRFKIAVGIAVGLLAVVIVGIITGAIGFYVGYTMNPSQNSPIRADAATPTPAPTTSATPTATPTPTPTPDIGGKYTGPSGEVDISNVTDKALTFSISVGNANGSGQIDGQATRTSPTVAVYSKIPDPDLYNDPESIYYKKKCHMTFRFAGGKIRISEDDYACSYWHGAQVDFNGTFSPAKKK